MSRLREKIANVDEVSSKLIEEAIDFLEQADGKLQEVKSFDNDASLEYFQKIQNIIDDLREF